MYKSYHYISATQIFFQFLKYPLELFCLKYFIQMNFFCPECSPLNSWHDSSFFKPVLKCNLIRDTFYGHLAKQHPFSGTSYISPLFSVTYLTLTQIILRCSQNWSEWPYSLVQARREFKTDIKLLGAWMPIIVRSSEAGNACLLTNI